MDSSKIQNGASPADPFARFGLIAGTGRFPLLFARSAKNHGVEIIAVAHKGQTLPELEGMVKKIYWIKGGQLGKLIKISKPKE